MIVEYHSLTPSDTSLFPGSSRHISAHTNTFCLSPSAILFLQRTFLISTSSYIVVNAVPFFVDLVALIGALTSVPLTLLLPAVLYRHICQVPVFALPQSRHDLASYLLVVFSLVFLLCGLFGALDSIELDWEKHGKPFSCY